MIREKFGLNEEDGKLMAGRPGAPESKNAGGGYLL